MNVEITDKIVMTSDRHNVILNEKKVATSDGTGKSKRRKGDFYLTPYAFYPTVQQALVGFVNQKMRESTATTIKGLVRRHSELTQAIDKVFETITGQTA